MLCIREYPCSVNISVFLWVDDIVAFIFQKNPFDFRPVQDTMNEKFFGNLNVEDIADYLNTKHVFVDADVGKNQQLSVSPEHFVWVFLSFKCLSFYLSYWPS